MKESYTLKNTKFFHTDKSKTDGFFKETKVTSCSHVLIKNGNSVAVPFKITNEKGHPLLHYKYAPENLPEKKSIYKNDYSIKPSMHVGMVHKPLVTYDPNSYRNRLPVGGVIMPHKNKSVVEIGDRGYFK